MKNILTLAAVACLAVGATAQTLVVYPTNGEPIVYQASEIDHIEFVPATGDEEDKPLEVYELWSQRGDYRIYGKMYRPALTADKPLPTVILSHSASLTADAMNAYATAIAEAGYCAYAFDFCGACDSSRSDGSTDEMTVFTEVDDLRAVIDCMRQQPGVDSDHIFLLGSSQGGLVSALTAEDAGIDIAGMILFYPAFNIPDLIAMMDQFGGFGGGSFGGSFGMGYSEAFCDAMRGYDVYANIGTFSRPLIIVHGSQDIIVNISYSEQAVATYPNATLYTIQGANHGFNSDNLGSFGSMMGNTANYDDQVIPIVLDYLRSRLNN